MKTEVEFLDVDRTEGVEVDNAFAAFCGMFERRSISMDIAIG